MSRILLVDDHAVVRKGVRETLAEALPDAAFEEAGAPDEALARLAADAFDLVLLDLALPGRGGLDTLREIRRLHPLTRVLVLSMHPEEAYAARVLRAGASGYVTKGSDPRDLVEAVRRTIAGGTYVSARLGEVLAVSLRGAAGQAGHERLSDRELEVLRGISAGRTVKEIALEMALSEKTVSTYRTRLLSKLGLRTNADLVQYARASGLSE